MENKTTIELLTLLENLKEGDYENDGKYQQIMEVIKDREPFAQILNEIYDGSLPQLLDRIEYLEQEVKKLKRHKHDQVSGDVLIRI